MSSRRLYKNVSESNIVILAKKSLDDSLITNQTEHYHANFVRNPKMVRYDNYY